MMDKASGASVSTLTDMVNAVLPQVETSLNVNEILSVLGSVAGYNMQLKRCLQHFKEGRKNRLLFIIL